MTPDLPPPPPPVEVPADAPTVAVPVPTLRWLAARDLYAEELRAYALNLQAAHLLTVADVEALRWERDTLARELAVAERRPRWSWVAAATVGGLVVGVVGWEIVR